MFDNKSTPVVVENNSTVQKPKKKGIWGFFVVLGALLLKFKFVLVALKFGKFFGTFLSMILMIAVYGSMYGWWYGIGFVLLIAVHESGHMFAAQKMGLATSAPMFIPFVGAFISLKDQPMDAKTEAIVAFGGPVLGSIAALACLMVGIQYSSPIMLALAYSGFMLNLFNLVPLHPLDGGRIVTAITPWMWIVGLVVIAFVAIKWHNPIVIFMLILGAIQAWRYFRATDKKYYQVDASVRTVFALIYFGLVGLLGVGMYYVHSIQAPLVQ
jgi:Zn-dependent protease